MRNVLCTGHALFWGSWEIWKYRQWRMTAGRGCTPKFQYCPIWKKKEKNEMIPSWSRWFLIKCPTDGVHVLAERRASASSRREASRLGALGAKRAENPPVPWGCTRRGGAASFVSSSSSFSSLRREQAQGQTCGFHPWLNTTAPCSFDYLLLLKRLSR